MNDVTIIIQGPMGQKIANGLAKGIKNLETYVQFGKIIISTWKNNPIRPSKKFLSKHNITMIESDPDIYKNMYSNANMNYQVASTLNGLKKVDTKYVIKIRSDEYYSDLSKFIEKIKNNPEKIITNNFFFSQDDYEPFHPSDHVIGGTTENLLSMFNYAFKVCSKELGSIPLASNYFNLPNWRNRDGNRQVSPETFLCFCYLLSKGVKLDLKKSKEIMKKYYDVVPVTSMGSFICKFQHSAVDKNSYIRKKSKNPKNYIDSMEEL